MNSRNVLFQLPVQTPSEDVVKNTLFVIVSKQRKQHVLRMWFFGVCSIGSLSALVPVVIATARAFEGSNFNSYMSIIFSDTSLFMTYWKQLGLSLVESLPVLSVVMTLSLIGVFLWSIRSFTSRIQRVQYAY